MSLLNGSIDSDLLLRPFPSLNLTCNFHIFNLWSDLCIQFRLASLGAECIPHCIRYLDCLLVANTCRSQWHVMILSRSSNVSDFILCSLSSMPKQSPKIICFSSFLFLILLSVDYLAVGRVSKNVG